MPISVPQNERAASARASYMNDPLALHADISYFYQFAELSALPSPLSPLVGILGSLKPYHRATVDVYKGFLNDTVGISGGAEFRLLAPGEDESDFNHSFHHEYLVVSATDLFLSGLNVSVHGDLWQALGDER